MKHFHHGLLADAHHRAIGYCGCGAQAERLASEATFSEEIALVQNADGGFLPLFDTTVSLTFPSVY